MWRMHPLRFPPVIAGKGEGWGFLRVEEKWQLAILVR